MITKTHSWHILEANRNKQWHLSIFKLHPHERAAKRTFSSFNFFEPNITQGILDLIRITVYLSISFFSLSLHFSILTHNQSQIRIRTFRCFFMHHVFLSLFVSKWFVSEKTNKCNTVYDFPWFESYLGIQNRLISTEHVGALRRCKCTLHRFQSLFDKQSHRNIVRV